MPIGKKQKRKRKKKDQTKTNPKMKHFLIVKLQLVYLKILKKIVKLNNKVGYRGMTLEQYFKTRDQTEVKDQASADENPFEKSGAQEQFQINESDQVNYYQNKKIVKTPQFTELPDMEILASNGKQQLQSKMFNKYAKKTIKLKTQLHEQQDYTFSQYRSKQKSKKRFPTMIQEEMNIPSKVELHETFYKDENKKNKIRVISNPVQKKEIKIRLITLSDFYKQQNHSLQKTKMLQKIQDDKSKLNDIRINEIGFITKYAAKFHITKSVCKQLLREQQLRL